MPTARRRTNAKRTCFSAGVAALGLVALTPSSSAACELDHHDSDVDWGYYERYLQAAQAKRAPRPSRFEARALLRYTRGTTPRLASGYFETRLRGEYRSDRYAAGLFWSLVALDTPGGVVAAAGNPVAFGEVRLALSSALDLALGTQVEVPVGTDDRVATSHFEVLPYAELRASFERVSMTTVAGLRQGLDSGATHDHDRRLVVDPHGRRELLLGLRAQLMGPIRPALALEAQHVLDAHVHGERTYFTSSLLLPVRLNEIFGLQLSGAVPLTRPSRVGWRLGVSLGAML